MSKRRFDKIVMFCGDIETTAYFSRQMEKTFLEKGYQTLFFDYENVAESSSKFIRFLEKGKTAVVTFNYHGLCGNSEIFFDEETNRYIWDDYEIPCFNIVVDHPFYYHRFLSCIPEKYIHINIDRFHEKYLEEYFPEVENGGFLPLAGTSLYEDGNYPKIAERPYDIVFTGNYVPPENFNLYIERIDEEYAAFYRGVLKELIDDPSLLLEDVMKRHTLKEIPEATHDEIKETLGNIIFLDMYIRFYFRGEVVRILAEGGLKVHVYGTGWEELPCKNPENIICGGSLNSLQCLEKLAEGKISLNVMPWFKDGAHDRVFNSMLNGAVCLTDSSIYFDRILEDEKNCAKYSLSNLEKLPMIVKRLLDHPEKMQKIADAGYQMALLNHTWKQRAEELILKFL